MKYLVVVPDGAADKPLPELENKTPLQTARKPNIDALAARARVGMARMVPENMEAGSDVAIMSVMGYDPRQYYTGRGPLEVASLNIALEKNDVAFRCNLVTIKGDILADYSSGHITTEEAKVLINMVDSRLGSKKIKFYPGTGYRHLMVWRGGPSGINGTPPHNIVGKPYKEYLPTGTGKTEVTRLMEISKLLLEGHEINRLRRSQGRNSANMIWLWGAGKAPAIPTFQQRFNLEGGVISAVDLIKGLGRYAGLEPVNVHGATGYYDTDYNAKAEAAIKILKKKNFCLVHIEATDEAGHNGETAEKIRAIENLDEKIVGPVLSFLEKSGEYRVMILPDHPTPISIKAHSADPVPWMMAGAGITASGVDSWNESTCASGEMVEEGYKLIETLVNQ